MIGLIAPVGVWDASFSVPPFWGRRRPNEAEDCEGCAPPHAASAAATTVLDMPISRPPFA